jgi:hypothetical protein
MSLRSRIIDINGIHREKVISQIEDPLKEICCMISSVPDTCTFMSCGGHWKPDRKSHCSEPIDRIWIAIHSTNKGFIEHMIEHGANYMGDWGGINRMDIIVHKCYLNRIHEAVDEYLSSMKFSIKEIQ